MSDADQQPDDFGRRPTIGYDAARGADQSANPAQSTEQLADRYQLQERLGGGGMGEVWRAIDLRLERPVAVNRIRRDLVRHPEAVKRFLTEARAVARLNHVNIVQIYDYGDDPGGPYLVMELVQGQSLASLVKETGPMDPAAAIRITRQVCDALSLAHQNGIVHRDAPHASRSASPRETRSRSCLGRRMTDTAQGRRHGASSDCPAMARGATVLAPHGASGAAPPPPPPGRPPPVVAPSP